MKLTKKWLGYFTRFLQLSLVISFLFRPLLADAAPQKLTVMLDWLVNPNHAALIVAQQQGYFAQQGLDVNLLSPADPNDPPKLAAVGKVDLAITYQPQWLVQQAQGLPLIWVANLIDHPLDCLIADSSQGVKKISDLKNKKVAYSVSATSQAILGAMLATHHLKLEDLQLINVHYDLVQALLAKKVVAIDGAMRNVELIELQQNHFPAIAFYPEQNGVPSYAELIFVANKSLQHDPRLPKFIFALQEGVAYLKAHPEATWQVFIKQYPNLNDAVNHQSWLVTIPYFADQPGKFNAKQNEQLRQFLQKQGAL